MENFMIFEIIDYHTEDEGFFKVEFKIMPSERLFSLKCPIELIGQDGLVHLNQLSSDDKSVFEYCGVENCKTIIIAAAQKAGYSIVLGYSIISVPVKTPAGEDSASYQVPPPIPSGISPEGPPNKGNNMEDKNDKVAIWESALRIVIHELNHLENNLKYLQNDDPKNHSITMAVMRSEYHKIFQAAHEARINLCSKFNHQIEQEKKNNG